MNAISLHQPWALFAVAGLKPWETRSWSCQQFGPLLIHASLKVDRVGRELWSQVWREFPEEISRACGVQAPFDSLARGAIVGRVDFTTITNFDVTPKGLAALLGDFSEGRWFWGFTNPVQFKEPIPCRGYQRVWKFRGELPTTNAHE